MTTHTIKFKRGVKSKLNNLSYGEPAYISDEGELYIGTENGVEKLTSNKEVKELSSQLAHIENVTNLLIEDYSEYAEGNDYSNVITYIMDNVVDETKRTVINFKPGKDYIINAKINKRNVTLTGSANIIGKLEVGLDDLNLNDTDNPWYDTMMHCIIDGLSFIPTMNFPHWDRYNEHGIWLFNARSVTIRNCYFANMKYPIYFKRNKGEWIHQHTHRVRILNCTFMCVGYNLYGEDYNIERRPSQYLEYGDIDFQGNFCEETKIANIKMASMDGFTCFNNTFFLEKAQGNIDIYYTPGIHISNNRIFEPGTRAINIYKTQDCVITGNHIFNAGYKNNESAIRIECGLWTEKDYGICGVISDNIFRKCQGSAIEIVNSIDEYGCTNYIITSNYIHIEGSEDKPIKVSGYSQGVVISNNISNKIIDVRSATYAIANNNAISDRPGSFDNDNLWAQWNNKDGDSTMKLEHLGANQVLIDTTGNPAVITIEEPSDKTLISNFKMLVVKSMYGQTTLKNSTFIQTKSKTDINLGANEIAIFTYVDGVYRQIF